MRGICCGIAASIPRISRDYPPMAAPGGLRLHSLACRRAVKTSALCLVRLVFVLGERRVWDSNPR
jgi:hypothetical protein